MAQKSYYRLRKEEVIILIAEAKTKNNFNNVQLAKAIGMPANTLNRKTKHPGTLRLEQLWAIEKLAGR